MILFQIFGCGAEVFVTDEASFIRNFAVINIGRMRGNININKIQILAGSAGKVLQIVRVTEGFEHGQPALSHE